MSRRLFTYCNPCVIDPYTTKLNVELIREKLLCILGVEISECSICMVLKHIRDDPRQYQTFLDINERVVAYIVNHYENYLSERSRNRNWAEHYKDSQLILNPLGKTGPDFNAVKVANRFGRCMVGGSLNFYFT